MDSRSTGSELLSTVHESEERVTGVPHSAPNPPPENGEKPGPRRRQDVDPETGQLLPISAEEWQARMEELTRRLAEIDAADDTPQEVYDTVMRNIDEERRRQGRPPAFEGCY